MSSNLQQFNAVDPNAEAAEEATLNSGSRLKFKSGLKMVMRVFPPLSGEKKALSARAAHYVVIPGAQKKVVHNCPRIMGRPPQFCRSCDEADRMKRTGNPADAEAAKEVSANTSMLGRAVDRAHPELGVQKFAFTKAAFDAFTAQWRLVDDETGHYSDPARGRDVVVLRVGEKLDTKWTFQFRAPSALGTPEQVAVWLEAAPSLDDDLRVPSPEEVDQRLGITGRTAPGRAASRASRTAADGIGNAQDVEFSETEANVVSGAPDEDVPF